MIFENSDISLSEIPSADSVEWQRVEPGLKRVKQLNWLLLWLIVIAVWIALVLFIDELEDVTTVTLVSIGLALLSGFHFYAQMKSVAFMAYAVREHDLLYRSGWLVRTVRVCPFNRVQHCSVSTGIFDRKFGVSSLRMFTAGGNDADVKVQGLQLKVANDLRNWIVSKIHKDGAGV